MKILLIDADSIIPNIALMKISAWHKSMGDQVELVKANLPYYPRKKKIPFFAKKADKVYCSVLFEGNADYIIGENIIFGGTGYDLAKKIPEEADKFDPDYSIYPENNISYGFITRGCIRNCSFCKVPQKEGNIRIEGSVESIVKHKKVKFLDNNILSLPEHKKILSELVEKNIRCQFNQGLDIRLLDAENSVLLSKMNYIGEYIFAFDSWKYKKIIEKKILLLSWRKPYEIKFFVYVHPKMPISETVKRITWLKENECLPYLMRDISCWESEHSDFFTDLAAYCNQPNIFKKMGFEAFLKKRHRNAERIKKSKGLWNQTDLRL